MNDKYFRENEWWVSPYNYAPEVRKSYDLPPRVPYLTIQSLVNLRGRWR